MWLASELNSSLPSGNRAEKDGTEISCAARRFSLAAQGTKCAGCSSAPPAGGATHQRNKQQHHCTGQPCNSFVLMKDFQMLYANIIFAIFFPQYCLISFNWLSSLSSSTF